MISSLLVKLTTIPYDTVPEYTLTILQMQSISFSMYSYNRIQRHSYKYTSFSRPLDFTKTPMKE